MHGVRAKTEFVLQHLLAMVFAYFKRANFAPHEYTKMNFFAAL